MGTISTSRNAPSAGPPAGVARPGSPEFEHQRRLLLELAVDPPSAGDEVAALATALGSHVDVRGQAGGRRVPDRRPYRGASLDQPGDHGAAHPRPDDR